MSTFKPTHQITVSWPHGEETVAVMLVDGSAYTRVEWDATASADWERSDDGEWTFQGQAVPSGAVSVSVRRAEVES
jgi:hypothetical protein